VSFKIGKKFRHSDGYLYHLRGFVDGLFVMRYWARHKKRWGYEIVAPYAIEIGLLKPV
jgi:hypothetical protein